MSVDDRQFGTDDEYDAGEEDEEEESDEVDSDNDGEEDEEDDDDGPVNTAQLPPPSIDSGSDEPPALLHEPLYLTPDHSD
jgi:hypothetical protein